MIVHVGDAIVRGVGFGFGGDLFVPPLEERALKELGLTWDDLVGVIDEVDTSLDEVDCSDFTN